MDKELSLPPIFSDGENNKEEEKRHPSPNNSVLDVNSRDHSTPHAEGGEGRKFSDKESEKDSVKDEAYFKRLQKEKIEEEMKHLSRDMWFTKLIVTKTWLVLLLSVSFILLMTFLCVVLGGFELSDEHDRDYLVWDDKLVKEWDMLELGKERIQTNYAGGIQPLRTTTIDDWTTSITFECKNCTNILTADFIKEMYAIEQKVVTNSKYGTFCQATSSTDSTCDPDAYDSFSKNFAGTINTLTQAQVDTFLGTVQSTDSIYDDNKIYLESTFTQSNLVSTKARAIFKFAGPIEIDGKRYKTYTDDEVKQSEKFVSFSKELLKEVEGSSDDMNIHLYNSDWLNDKINDFVMGDFTLAGLSFMLVLIYVSFHLKSVFLASCAMLAIGFSYPIAIVINRFIFQVDFFQSLNFVAVFVILGISADNVFVFTDSWQQSGQYDLLNTDNKDRKNNFQKRMNYTWRKATKAISTTSFTTAMAFLSTGFSLIMPISAFGYFASVLVVVNYTFAIITFPA